MIRKGYPVHYRGTGTGFLALMEAMAMKTPPVSTTVSGIPELIDDGVNGLLVPPRDSTATGEAVLRLLEDDVEWSTYCENARSKVEEEFNMRKEAQKLESTFIHASEL